MIREATYRDLSWLTDLAVEFNDRFYDEPIDYWKTYDYLEHVLDIGVIFRSDTGAIAGAIHRDERWASRVAVELGWYSEGADGIRLWKAFETWAKRMEADQIAMSALVTSDPRLDAVMHKRGYEVAEITYKKKLE